MPTPLLDRRESEESKNACCFFTLLRNLSFFILSTLSFSSFCSGVRSPRNRGREKRCYKCSPEGETRQRKGGRQTERGKEKETENSLSVDPPASGRDCHRRRSSPSSNRPAAPPPAAPPAAPPVSSSKERSQHPWGPQGPPPVRQPRVDVLEEIITVAHRQTQEVDGDAAARGPEQRREREQHPGEVGRGERRDTQKGHAHVPVPPGPDVDHHERQRRPQELDAAAGEGRGGGDGGRSGHEHPREVERPVPERPLLELLGVFHEEKHVEHKVEREVSEVQKAGREAPDLAALEDEAGVVVEREGRDEVEGAGGGGEDAEGDVGPRDDRELGGILGFGFWGGAERMKMKGGPKERRSRSEREKEEEERRAFEVLSVIAPVLSALSFSFSLYFLSLSPACTSPRTTVVCVSMREVARGACRDKGRSKRDVCE